MDIIEEIESIEVKNDEIKTAITEATQIFKWLRSPNSASIIPDNGIVSIDSWLKKWANSETTLES